MKKLSAVFAAFILCAVLSGCQSARGGAKPTKSTAAETTVTTAKTTATTVKVTSAATTVSTSTASATTVTTASESTASAGTSATTVSASATSATTAAAGANPDGKPVKILWSERGLEAQPGESTEGYGEPLTVGAEYLEWKLENYDGKASGSGVSELNADFSRKTPLSVNGIVTVLPAAHSEYAGKLYLRVDNQSEFPYFPADKRERGYFAVENTDEVWKMLGEENPPKEISLAVTFSVDALHIHYGGTRCDTVRVSAASKR